MKPVDPSATLRCVALLPGPHQVWSYMFVSRLKQSGAPLRSVGTAAIGTAVIAAGLVTTATPASAEDGVATVTLTVDGVSTSVDTTTTTVSDLLAEQAVPLDGTDLVSPGYESPLFDGMSVSWVPAKRVFVRHNGERTAHMVVGDTVRQVTTELNLPTGTKDSRRDAYSFEDARMYGPEGARLAADETVRENSVAIVHKIRFAFRDRHLRIERKVVKDRSPLVRSGGVRVLKEGRDGRKYVVYRKRFLDGELTSKRIVKSNVIRDANRRVVLVGTGPNWVGLADCESGGNPNAINPAGFYGLYQFSISTWRSVGGKGIPTDYGYWEQTKRAWKLYKMSGSSPWPVCGSRL